ncbi:LacI family DNA-binding transcriptional regulator [Microlunatus soli]|uniref:Transcriptional regulator, LacI family n=1 Tax=Microlunatus soli TaxID=630515 RepID=A0A1H2ADI9_9ACTN|nr:LacI family DNA-binding transcriptional regulator [Microlunatus soli]SDT43812.1 transcriptional regulator, LacI family [Microlunatus soli]
MADSTRSDVARLAGVSPAVVSYVVNGGPRPVSRAARERVEEAIATLGYRPNKLANAFRHGRTRSVGLLLPAPINPFYAELAAMVEGELLTAEYIASMAISSFNAERDAQHLQSFIDRRMDGLIIASGASLPTDHVDLDTVPHVILDSGARTATGADPHVRVHTDERHDVGRAVDHLRLHGHQVIGCIAGPPSWPVNAGRVAVWRDQLRAADLPAGADLVAHADLTEHGGATALRSLLAEDAYRRSRRDHHPTALFVASDVQAFGVLRACYELGISVPQDLAIVSFDGVAAAAYTQPRLTTMRQPMSEIVRTSTRLLVQQIETGDRPGPAEITIRGNLVIGESCGCLPAGGRRSTTESAAGRRTTS